MSDDLRERELRRERGMADAGTALTRARIDGAIEKGRVEAVPWASDTFTEFVPALAEQLAGDIAKATAGSAGRLAVHISLLKTLNVQAVAYLTVRYALSCSQEVPVLSAARDLGREVYMELVAQEFAETLPDLYHTVAQSLDRRLSKDARHRYATFLSQARANGFHPPVWGTNQRAQVGAALLGYCCAMGLLVREVSTNTIAWSEELTAKALRMREACSMLSPAVGPMISPPEPRGALGEGGYYLPRLASRTPALRGFLGLPEVPRAALNLCQGTAWRVNAEVLAVVQEVAQTNRVGELVSSAVLDKERPAKPAWLQPGMKTKDLPEDMALEVRAWKTQTRLWHERNKMAGGKVRRCGHALSCARADLQEPALYFVHFADSRGRLYPYSSGGLTPQGSDLQKGLLHFANGEPLDSPGAVRWFLIHGANTWGFDKATLDERAAWHTQHTELLLSIADDPVNNTEWLNADSPVCFLAWVLEYRRYVRDSRNFLSHLPIAMDGSCNGLQHLSAALRDPIGGYATNLTSTETMQDIYRTVATAATKRIGEMECKDEYTESLRKAWVEKGIARSVVKRSVMCTPYGVTKRTATGYVVSDNIGSGVLPDLSDADLQESAKVLMDAVWPAIGDIVVKGTELMTFLQKGARKIVKETGSERISWETPSGFPAGQVYYEEEITRIKLHVHGTVSVRCLSDTDQPSASKHSSGLAPNFVHSLDASHLHMVCASLAAQGIKDVSMIHDSYGVHARYAEVLAATLREEFVRLYEEHDPVGALCERYPVLGEPPSKGSLDLREVLNSDYFFS